MNLANVMRLLITNLPLLLLISAFVAASWSKSIPNTAERYLAWLLLLPVGGEMLWAGFFHVFFPAMSASFIGWQDSPFHFEIGVADLAIGVVAVASFWRGLEFKSAVVAYVVLFYIGVAIGHVHQAIIASNFAPGNFGLLLAMTIGKVLLLSILLIQAHRAPAATEYHAGFGVAGGRA
jgi:hypothetical protein